MLSETTFSEEGFGISDNSYMLMALQFGGIFAIFWFIFFIRLLMRNVLDWFTFLFTIYVLIGLGLTNGILWEPWVYVATLSATILYKKVKLESTKLSDHNPAEPAIFRFEEAPQRQF
jgi:hypothetical protein